SDEARRFVEQERGKAGAGEENLWIIADAGRSGNEGAAAFFDSEARKVFGVSVREEDLAPSILARLGVPPARDLDGSPLVPLFVPGSLDLQTVASFGRRTSREPVAEESVSGREYLKRLKSLGYLN
ncbi:MAG: hypothetical protein ACRD16_08190, partial [Thermoanaerobaculia bacterium]